MREALPAGLAGLPDDRLAAAWPDWVRERDRAVRERLVRGEEDAVVNLLFFGTSFTKAPRLTTAVLGGTRRDAEKAVAGRLRDLAERPGPARGRRAAPAVPLPPRAPEAEAGRPDRAAGRVVVARHRGPRPARAGRLRGRAGEGPGPARRHLAARRALDALPRPRHRPRHVPAARVRPRRGPGGRAGARPSHRRLRPPRRGRGPGPRLRGEGRGPGLLPAAVDAGARPLRLAGAPRPVAPREPLGHRLRHQPARPRPPGAGPLTRAAGEGYVLQLPRPREGWAAPFVAYWQRLRRRGRGPGRGGDGRRPRRARSRSARCASGRRSPPPSAPST